MAISFSKPCYKQYAALRTGNRKVYQKCAALVANLTMGDDPLQAPRPESRIPDAVKWDLGDGYRILGIKADSGVLFLAAGTHDTVEEFIGRYRGSYASKDRSNVLQLEKPLITDTTLDVDEEYPFRDLCPEIFTYFNIPKETADGLIKVLRGIKNADSPELMEFLSTQPPHISELLLQYATEKSTRPGIEQLVRGEMDKVEGAALLSAVQQIGRSEQFITFSDPEDLELALTRSQDEWMLFLHPTQKRWAYSTFAGPARLRGIAGSGKTSVAIHRASFLARTFCGERDRVLFTTFSPNLADVVKRSLQMLCGLEINQIEVRTIGQWCSDFIRTNAGPFEFLRGRDARDKHFMPVYRTFREKFPAERLWKMATPEYVFEEVLYIKSKFSDDDVERYLTIVSCPASLRHHRTV